MKCRHCYIVLAIAATLATIKANASVSNGAFFSSDFWHNVPPIILLAAFMAYLAFLAFKVKKRHEDDE